MNILGSYDRKKEWNNERMDLKTHSVNLNKVNENIINMELRRVSETIVKENEKLRMEYDEPRRKSQNRKKEK